MTFADIKQDKKLSKKFRAAFDACLDSCREHLIGNPKTDYIINSFEQQGYWAGDAYKISFDFDLGFEYEQRHFGK